MENKAYEAAAEENGVAVAVDGGSEVGGGANGSVSSVASVEKKAKSHDHRVHIDRRRMMNKRTASVTDENEQVVFSWDNITVQAKVAAPGGGGGDDSGGGGRFKLPFLKKKNGGGAKITKTILKSASGYVQPGELVAIMGASGAGKSTLLNALTFRNLDGLEIVSGGRYANGVTVTPNSLTAVSGYVQQDDLFIGTLSVRETLEFQALVRMERQIPKKQRYERVTSVLQELGLTKCEDTLVGVPGRVKGISGGEMKRLAFACEVLTNPALFFCDEPTSGLDSYMAQNVVEVLRTLARQGKTIVCTIHQPSSQVYSLFDKVLLMAEGRLAFLGHLDEAREFFSKAGYPCPMNYNPADHYVHVLAVTPGQEEECRATVNRICDTFMESPEGQAVLEEVEYEKTHERQLPGLLVMGGSDGTKRSPYRASWWEQFTAVQWRSFLSVIKEPMLIQVRLFQTILIALVLGVIYLDQDYLSDEGVMNINGALFLILTNMTFQNMFAVINVFCQELPIFLREHFNGMYRTDVYYICKQIAELPIFLLIPILFLSIFYWMVGFNEDIDRYLFCNLIVLLVTQVVVSFGYFISCISPNLQVALALAPPLIIPIMLFGGFFLNSNSIPGWLSWLQYLSWFKYANELLVINQWHDVTLDCGKNASYIPDDCTYPNGESILTFYGFDEDNVTFNYIMLVVLAVAMRVFGFFALLMKTFRKGK